MVAELHDPIEISMRFVSDDKMDPILEVWIDCSRSPVAVRLDGVLDGTTRSAFLSVMSDLMLEGVQTVVIDAGAVEIVDALGAEALALCHRRLRETCRILVWDGVDCT
jgi:anti-anti-sigma regulatory factor